MWLSQCENEWFHFVSPNASNQDLAESFLREGVLTVWFSGRLNSVQRAEWNKVQLSWALGAAQLSSAKACYTISNSVDSSTACSSCLLQLNCNWQYICFFSDWAMFSHADVFICQQGGSAELHWRAGLRLSNLCVQAGSAASFLQLLLAILYNQC